MDEIKNMPKVELHLHLDGSVSLNMASKLSGLSLDEVREKMVANDKCKDLSEYLTKFDFPISLTQTKENLEKIAKDLVDRLATQNVIYAEIRFAPMFHIKGGLTYDEVVDAVLKGLKSNIKVKTNLILCLMRGMKKEENMMTLEVASRYLNKGVCGIDLAGDEGLYSLDAYLNFFELANIKEIPFTIHVGEARGPEEIQKAISIGAKRIGHGIHCLNDDYTTQLIKNNNVLLELCPTSNVQTGAVESYSLHPIYEMYKNNILLSVNTDNTTVSNISITGEYLKLIDNFYFSLEDFRQMNINAIDKAFISDYEKSRLKAML